MLLGEKKVGTYYSEGRNMMVFHADSVVDTSMINEYGEKWNLACLESQ